MPENKPRLSGFEFLESLGRGAFGEVWLARDLNLKVLRAVKIVAPDRFREQDVRRLVAEAQALAALPHHRNRVIVHQIKDGVTNCFLVMDYLAGGPLDRLTAPDRPMPWPRAVRYIAGVGDALLEMHQRGLLHRDVKPSNILLDPERDEAVLGDFGLAVTLGGVNRAAGTRGYMAPEAGQSGRVGPRCDVYSLAASLLHLVTGRPPVPLPTGETSPEADRVTAFGPGAPAGGPCWPAEVPEEVRAVIACGMEPEPDRREDLPRFLWLLREARWRRLAEEVLTRPPGEANPVRLVASLAVAAADAPQAFTPVASHELRHRRMRTGDLVRIDSVASAEGHQTILLLGSSGGLEVVLPRPTAEANFFAAGQPHRLLLRLAPPTGRERVLVIWSRQDVRRSAREWQQWLERRGEDLAGTVPQPPRRAVRAMDFLGAAAGQPPQGSWRVLAVSLDHTEAGAVGAEGAGQDQPPD
jgi:hypothetical protein